MAAAFIAGRSIAMPSSPPSTASTVFSDGSPVTSFGITTWTMGRRPAAGAGGVGDVPPGTVATAYWRSSAACRPFTNAAMASRLPPLGSDDAARVYFSTFDPAGSFPAATW